MSKRCGYNMNRGYSPAMFCNRESGHNGQHWVESAIFVPPAQLSASEGERFCDICKQDISGHEFDGHCSVVCHKPSCIEKFAHPEGERVEQVIGKTDVIGSAYGRMCVEIRPSLMHVMLDERFPEGAVGEIVFRLVPTKGGAG